ncbi:MAG TPA: ubiquitin-like domain-containing protein [Longilinea sp.]|nr:ubiquitin-like domain-containing protein [Longilinea sp.]
MKKKWLWIGVPAAVLLVFVIVWFALRRPVTLIVDGVTQTVNTSAPFAGMILGDEGIEYETGDILSPSAGSWVPAGGQITLDRIRPYTLVIDPGNTRLTVNSSSRIPVVVMQQAGLLYQTGDRISWNGLAVDATQPLPSAGDYTLLIRLSQTITLTIDGQTQTIQSAAPTLAAALWEAGIALDSADQLSIPADTALNGPITVELRRAVPLTLQVNGQSLAIRSAGSTVGAALAQAGYPLQGADYSIPAEGEPLPSDGNIRLVHVQETIELSQSLLPFTTEYVEDPNTELDHSSVVTEGQYGLEVSRERTRFEDGVETTTTDEGSWVAQPAITEQLGMGTQVVIRTLETPNGTVEYWRTVTVFATAYSPCQSGVPGCLYGTSSGMPVARGTIAVTRTWYNLMVGQQLYVPGYGVGTIGDTGGGFPDRYWIDLAFTDEDFQGWANWVTIYFLVPVPDYIPLVLP